MIIRKATLADADVLMKIERASGYPLPQYFWDRGHYKKFIKNEIVFVAIDKKPIGFVLVKNKFHDGAEIDTIAVLKKYHGTDVANKLLRRAEKAIGKNKKVYVRCWNKNFPAIGFYNKNKYCVIAIKNRNYSGRETGLLMCKDL